MGGTLGKKFVYFILFVMYRYSESIHGPFLLQTLDQHALDQCSMPQSNVPRSNGLKFPQSTSAQKAHPCPIVLWHIIPCYHCLHYPILVHCSSLLLFAYYYI